MSALTRRRVAVAAAIVVGLLLFAVQTLGQDLATTPRAKAGVCAGVLVGGMLVALARRRWVALPMSEGEGAVVSGGWGLLAGQTLLALLSATHGWALVATVVIAVPLVVALLWWRLRSGRRARQERYDVALAEAPSEPEGPEEDQSTSVPHERAQPS